MEPLPTSSAVQRVIFHEKASGPDLGAETHPFGGEDVGTGTFEEAQAQEANDIEMGDLWLFNERLTHENFNLEVFGENWNSESLGGIVDPFLPPETF